MNVTKLMAMIVGMVVGSLSANEPKLPKERMEGRVEPGALLMQSDFTSGLGGWKISNFENALTVEVSDGALFVGNAGKDRDTSFLVTSAPFAVSAGGVLAVILEARGNVSMCAPYNRYHPATGLLWYDADRRPIMVQNMLGQMVQASSDFGFTSLGTTWNRSVRFCAVPEGAAFAAFQVGGDGPDVKAGQRLEIRRIAVRAKTSDADWDFGDLEPPKFELLTETPNPDPHAVIRFRILDESKLDRSRFSCIIDGVNVYSNLVYEGKGVCVFKPAMTWEKDSLHLVELDVSDVCGNRGRETLAFFCGARRTTGVVTLRDDGMTLIDGKPFFPIGPFSFRKCPPNGSDLERGLMELKAGGCNMVHSYLMYQFGADQQKPMHRDYIELLDACEKTGMKLVVEAAGRDYGNPDRPLKIRENLLHGRDYSCLLAWGIGDDTSAFRTGGDVKNDHNVIKAIDNARLTTQADGSTFPGRYLQFVRSTDTFMDELYPFKAETPEPAALADFVRNLGNAFGDKKAAGDPVKGIWPLVQAFSGWSMWKRFPTTAEIRAQSYLGIIAGGRACTYYTYYSFSKGANGVAHKQEQLQSFFAVTRELASIHDDLASRDAKEQPNVIFLDGPSKDLRGNASVSCLLKDGAEGKGRLLVAASSTSEGPVKVRFDGVKGVVETLFENGRTVDAAKGLIDTFAPGDVHVYRLK